MDKKIEDIKNLIEDCKTVALFAHMNPDGDAIGSVLAFKNMLDSLKKETFVFLPTPISDTFDFLDIQNIVNKNKLGKYDLAICLDCPNTKRFGEWEKEFFKAKKSIKIDHHIVTDNFATICVVDEEISSTCELIFKIFKDLNVEITPNIATCLYTGIVTDTGRFTHGNHGEVTPETWRTVADLVECGADTKSVNYNVFIKMSRDVFELNKEVLSRVEFFADGKIAFVGIPKDVLLKTNTDMTDTHRFIDLFGGLEGVEITAFMTQIEDNENAVSIRTQIHNAQRICKHFGGGGHLRASGCRLFVPFEIAKSMLLYECKSELNRND